MHRSDIATPKGDGFQGIAIIESVFPDREGARNGIGDEFGFRRNAAKDAAGSEDAAKNPIRGGKGIAIGFEAFDVRIVQGDGEKGGVIARNGRVGFA